MAPKKRNAKTVQKNLDSAILQQERAKAALTRLITGEGTTSRRSSNDDLDARIKKQEKDIAKHTARIASLDAELKLLQEEEGDPNSPEAQRQPSPLTSLPPSRSGSAEPAQQEVVEEHAATAPKQPSPPPPSPSPQPDDNKKSPKPPSPPPPSPSPKPDDNKKSPKPPSPPPPSPSPKPDGNPKGDAAQATSSSPPTPLPKPDKLKAQSKPDVLEPQSQELHQDINVTDESLGSMAVVGAPVSFLEQCKLDIKAGKPLSPDVLELFTTVRDAQPGVIDKIIGNDKKGKSRDKKGKSNDKKGKSKEKKKTKKKTNGKKKKEETETETETETTLNPMSPNNKLLQPGDLEHPLFATCDTQEEVISQAYDGFADEYKCPAVKSGFLRCVGAHWNDLTGDALVELNRKTREKELFEDPVDIKILHCFGRAIILGILFALKIGDRDNACLPRRLNFLRRAVQYDPLILREAATTNEYIAEEFLTTPDGRLFRCRIHFNDRHRSGPCGSKCADDDDGDPDADDNAADDDDEPPEPKKKKTRGKKRSKSAADDTADDDDEPPEPKKKKTRGKKRGASAPAPRPIDTPDHFVGVAYAPEYGGGFAPKDLHCHCGCSRADALEEFYDFKVMRVKSSHPQLQDHAFPMRFIFNPLHRAFFLEAKRGLTDISYDDYYTGIRGWGPAGADDAWLSNSHKVRLAVRVAQLSLHSAAWYEREYGTNRDRTLVDVLTEMLPKPKAASESSSSGTGTGALSSKSGPEPNPTAGSTSIASTSSTPAAAGSSASEKRPSSITSMKSTVTQPTSCVASTSAAGGSASKKRPASPGSDVSAAKRMKTVESDEDEDDFDGPPITDSDA